MSRRILAALTCALVAGACNAGDAPSPAPTPDRVVLESDCPNAADAGTTPRLRIPPVLVGDVGGGSEEERVALAFDGDAARRCRALLAFEGDVEGVVALEGFTTEYGLPHPRLHALAAIDERDGYEIVIDMGAGASTQFVGVFTVRDGIVVELARPDDGTTGGLWPYGGSVGHVEAVDCIAGGGIVASIAVPHERRYRLTRTHYSVEDGMLAQQHVERHDVTLREALTYPEFERSPFGGCSEAD